MSDLVLSTFNLRNLQLPGRNRFPGAVPYEHDFYRRKIRWTGDLIRLVGPDVMGFEELWASSALEEALDHVNLDDDYEIISKPPDETGRQQNALIVHDRHDIVASEYIVDLPDDLVLEKGDGDETSIAVDTERFSRPVLKVVVDLEVGAPEKVRVTFLVAHLKSKRPMNLDRETLERETFRSPDRVALGSALSTIKRTAEAAALRVLVSRIQQPDQNDDPMPVVVMGDLNTSSNSTELDIITTQPQYRLEHGAGVGRSSKWGLYSVATLQHLRSLNDVYLTYLHHGFHDSLDHILGSQHFYDHSDSRIWSFREANVFNDHLPFAKLGADHEQHVADHGIVRAVFEYNPAE